ncbi:MAG: bifunctional riboflavin kinase/FAD synthetase [Firmicutes bacterium]|nr:bifunctional riboflavin kinase/FAD synthetase [Bacillota bacterium]
MIELSLEQKFKKPLVLGLGFFDCVHTGHRKLIESVVDYARNNACTAAITTFSNNPYRLFNPDAKVINLYAERLSVFKSLGLSAVLPFVFNADFKKMDKKDFLDALFSAFKIKALICGYDYLFGFKGAGDTEFLTQYCIKRKAEVLIIPPVAAFGERVSSTAIKGYIEQGDIERANNLLGAPFFADGTVTKGSGRGRSLGFPTANAVFKKSKLLPPDGVYQTQAFLDGKTYPSVTHIGKKPTFSDAAHSVETYLQGFNDDAYGKQIKIEFYKRLRGIEKFDSAEALADQIKKDLENESSAKN